MPWPRSSGAINEVGPIYRLRGPGRRYTVLAGPKANAVTLMALDRADFEEIVAESDLTAAESDRRLQISMPGLAANAWSRSVRLPSRSSSGS